MQLHFKMSATHGEHAFRQHCTTGGACSGVCTFSLAAKEAPIVTQPSAFVIISGVHDT